MNTIKMVIVGDHGVGKTSLCFSYTTKKFPSEYVPTSVPIGTDIWTFGLWDSPEYDRLRPLAVGSPVSFENIKDKWFPEVHQYCPGVPCLMVATQIDQRSDKEAVERMARLGQLPVSTHQGQKMARELGATKYLECSAKTHEGVKDVFEQGIAAAVASQTGAQQNGDAEKLWKRRCIVL
ncbi:P-loop containing nucleoside triphosphate hydrolase protein [Mycena capillaripes]|nr:P-loop containing nucleoside triphosphate hydrolase protein [Mycena capillaripes]